MKVTVIGTGYVGLVTGCCLAESGQDVTCVDNDAHKVKSLKAGKASIYEPGLPDLLLNNAKVGRLKFTTNLAEGVDGADVIFMALPTPPRDDGAADLTTLLAVAEELGSHLTSSFTVIINKSTVPVGTAEKVRQSVSKNVKKNFDVVSNPEFLREGQAIKDFMEPERVVIGLSSRKAESVMRALYAPFVDDEHPLLITDQVTAELIKYAANSFLVTKVSFMNELAELCELMGADVDMLRQAIGSDSRIGHKFLHPGIGCGGSCFPKDVRALQHMSKEHAFDFRILNAAITVNSRQQEILVEKVLAYYRHKVMDRTFALWGLAFKPNTDDIREAPALKIAEGLMAAGAKIQAYDPEANANTLVVYEDHPDFTIEQDKYEALNNADALIIATEWPQFGTANLSVIARQLKSPVIFDGRNIFNPKAAEDAGFDYFSIGRRAVRQSGAKSHQNAKLKAKRP